MIFPRASRLISSTIASRSSPLAISKLIRSRTRAPLPKGNDPRLDVVPADDPPMPISLPDVDLSPVRKYFPCPSSSEEEEWSSIRLPDLPENASACDSPWIRTSEKNRWLSVDELMDRFECSFLSLPLSARSSAKGILEVCLELRVLGRGFGVGQVNAFRNYCIVMIIGGGEEAILDHR